ERARPLARRRRSEADVAHRDLSALLRRRLVAEIGRRLAVVGEARGGEDLGARRGAGEEEDGPGDSHAATLARSGPARADTSWQSETAARGAVSERWHAH